MTAKKARGNRGKAERDFDKHPTQITKKNTLGNHEQRLVEQINVAATDILFLKKLHTLLNNVLNMVRRIKVKGPLIVPNT